MCFILVAGGLGGQIFSKTRHGDKDEKNLSQNKEIEEEKIIEKL